MNRLPDNEALRLKIKFLMADRKLSQVEVARQSGVTPSTLSHFLSGAHRTHPQIDNYCKLAMWAGMDDKPSTIDHGTTLDKIDYVLVKDESLDDEARAALYHLMEAAYARLAHQTKE